MVGLPEQLREKKGNGRTAVELLMVGTGGSRVAGAHGRIFTLFPTILERHGMREWFRQLSLRWQLTVVILLGSGGALLAMTFASLGYQRARFRQDAVRELTLVADLIGRNAATALAAGHTAAVREALTRLESEPMFLSARIVLTNGQAIAEYVRPGILLPPLSEHSEQPEFTMREIRLCRPITLDEQPLGILCVRAETWPWVLRVGAHMGIMLLVALAAALVSVGLAAWLQRLVAAPVRELARTVQNITTAHDYSLRVAPRGTAELTLLTQAINRMLDTISQRDQALRLDNVELEHNGAELQKELVEHRRTEEALRDREARLQALLAQVPAVLWTTDRQLRFTSSQGAALATLGLQPDVVVGQTLEQFFQTANPQFPALAAHEQALRGKTVRFEQPLAGRHYESQVEPLYNEQHEIIGCIGVALDVTDRIRAEEQLLAISDREQHRLGQDLHDGLCQHLTGTAFAAKVLEEQLRAQNRPEADEAAEICELIEVAIGQARATVRGLSPLPLNSPHGLEIALHELAASVQDIWGTPCVFQAHGTLPATDSATATHLYRIAQEALHNAVRHGRPQHIVVDLREADHALQLQVADDGIGLPVGAPVSDGLGLRIMHYRAKTIGATLEVRRGQPTGTVVRCLWPIPANSKESNHGKPDEDPRVDCG